MCLEGDALSPLGRSKKIKRGLELNGTHQLLIYGDDVNILDKNIYTIKKNTEAQTDTVKGVGLEANPEKTTCMFMLHHQNSGKNF
jgi:hypothetical protein